MINKQVALDPFIKFPDPKTKYEEFANRFTQSKSRLETLGKNDDLWKELKISVE